MRKMRILGNSFIRNKKTQKNFARLCLFALLEKMSDSESILTPATHPLVGKTVEALSSEFDSSDVPPHFWDSFQEVLTKVLRQQIPLVMKEHECLLALRDLNDLKEHLISHEKAEKIVPFDVYSLLLSQDFLKTQAEGVVITPLGLSFIAKGE